MLFLTKQEELFLLAVHRLEKEAYLVTIRDHLLTYTGKDWAFGSICITLNKLQKKGLIKTVIGEPAHVRGGKAIKYYQLTPSGMTMLVEAKQMQEVMWRGFTTPASYKKRTHEK